MSKEQKPEQDQSNNPALETPESSKAQTIKEDPPAPSQEPKNNELNQELDNSKAKSEEEQKNAEEKEKASRTRQAMIWMREGLDKGASKAGEAYNKAAESTFVKENYARYDKAMRNPVVKMLTSNLLSRSIGVVFITTAALGITAGGWPVAGAAIGALAVGMAIDTAVVDKTRRLYKEAKFLHRHRKAADQQKLILKQNPHIEEALANKLYKPKEEGKSKDKRLSKDASSASRYGKSYAGGLITSAIGFASTIVGAALSHSPFQAAQAAGGVAGSALGYGSTYSTLSEKREDFRKYIDSERDKKDSPAYDNLLDIRKAAREQKIQTMVLQELSKDPEIMSPTCDAEKIQKKFDEQKAKIESKEKAIIYRNNALYRTSQVVKNFFHAHNPLSEYSEPDKVGNKLFNKIDHPKKWNEATRQWDKGKVEVPKSKIEKPSAKIGSHRGHVANIKKQRANPPENHGR